MNNRKAGRPKGTVKLSQPCRVNGKVNKAYSRWIGMKQRCYNPKSHIFKYYGGRGITVCDRWLGKQGFNNFLADMGEPPPGMTLDRERNNEGYSPDNCRWATWDQQAKNRRPAPDKRNPNSLRQRAIAAGLSYSVVYQRCRLHGWSEEEALSTPCRPHGERFREWRRNPKEPLAEEGSLESEGHT